MISIIPVFLFPLRDASNQVLANLERDDLDPFASEHNLLNENEMGAADDNEQEDADDEQEAAEDEQEDAEAAIENQRDDFDPTWQEKILSKLYGINILC